MEINVENNSFIIKNLQESKLILENNHSKKVFSREEDEFVIKYKDLEELLKVKNFPLTFKNENGEDLILSDDIFKFESTVIKHNKSMYYIYVTKENKLSVIYNKKPSILNFYHNDGCIKEAKVENNTLIIQINYHCSIYKPISIEGKIKVRNKETEIKTIGQIVDISKNNHIYNVTANLIFKLDELNELFMGRIPDYIYNSDIYDISFNYKIEEMQISKYYTRLKFPLENKYNINDENWLTYDKEFMLLCRPYPTTYGNLSMRLIPVPKDTYNDFISQNYIKLNDNGKKNIVCMEYPEKAQENGLIYFKWLVQHLSQKFNIYYLISSRSNDLDNLKGYEEHIIYYKSRKNIAIVNSVDVICHSHSANYLLPFQTNKAEKIINQKNRVFLQHGIIGSKDVSTLYGRNGEDKVADLFVVSSEREKELVHQDYGFERNEIILTGLPRFDDVIKERKNIIKKLKNQKKILIMPTWRTGLNIYSDERFMGTNYYKEFQQLINNPELQRLVEEKGYKISFYLHRNFQVFSHLFSSEFVEVLTDQDHDVKDLLAKYQVLITDYSSVGLDFALMHKKVVYFRPETIVNDDFMSESTKLLPGEVMTNQQDLIKELLITKMSKKYKNNLDHLYKYADRKACKRISDAMINYFNLN